MKTIFLGFFDKHLQYFFDINATNSIYLKKIYIALLFLFHIISKSSFNLIIPETLLSTSEELIGEVAPVNNSFLIFGKKLASASFKTSTKLSRGISTIYAIWTSACVCVVSFFVSFGNFYCSIDWTIFWLPKKNELLHLPFHFCILEITILLPHLCHKH